MKWAARSFELYPGATDFLFANGQLHFKMITGQEVRLIMDSLGVKSVFCAAALIQFTEYNIEMTKEERYFSERQVAYKYYEFVF